MLSTYRGTHTQAPNFAFALAAKRFLAAPEQTRVRFGR